MPPPADRLPDLLSAPCACTGQCGTPHLQGACGREPTFSTRNLAAPADPSARTAAGDALLTWCPSCYTPALKHGRERRAKEQQMALERGQGLFF